MLTSLPVTWRLGGEALSLDENVFVARGEPRGEMWSGAMLGRTA
jgi:hypothetical protein